MTTRRSHTLIAICLVSALATTGVHAKPTKEQFESLCAKIQQNPDTVTDQEVSSVLDMGKDLGRPFTSSLAIKRFMSSRTNLSLPLLKKAIDNAILIGDYRLAVARCKNYLKTSPSDAQASIVAATLYRILIDFIGAKDDAYRFMGSDGVKFRATTTSRRYDSWFLSEAIRRQDHAGAARRLALVMSSPLPLEEERHVYWDHMDKLMAQIRTTHTQTSFSTIPHCKKFIPLIRGDELRKVKYGFYVANTGFKAGAAGKDRATLDTDFKAVITAADTYLTLAPTKETLQDILTVFGAGGWTHQQEAKQAFFTSAFSKLPDKDKEVMMGWQTYWATKDQWAQLGKQHAALFKRSPATTKMSFFQTSKDPASYKALSTFLTGVQSYDAAGINSLAAGATLDQMIDHLVLKESYHLRSEDIHALISKVIWPTFSSFPRPQALPVDHYGKAIVRFGEKHLSKTLIAFDEEATKNYMIYAWRNSGANKNDKTKVAKHLASLSWVPYSRNSRQKIFQPAYDEFKQWAKQIKKKDPAAAAQVAGLDEAFKLAMGPTSDPAKAPNPICKAMAQAVDAAKNQDSTAFVKIARTLYPLIKDYETKKTPMGEKALMYILRPSENMDVSDIQCEILTDQLKTLGPKGVDQTTVAIWDRIITSGKRWSAWRIPKQDRNRALKINSVLAKAVTAHLGKPGWNTLFSWMRSTRRGQGWDDRSLNQDVIGKMVEGKTLLNTTVRFGASSGAASYMWLLRNEFSGAPKYDYSRYFDDMFVEEATKTKFLDIAYWNNGGRDEKYKIRNLAAKMLPEYSTLPVGYGTQKPSYTLGNIWRWHGYALGAHQGVRNTFLDKIEALYGTARFDHYAMGSQSIWYRNIDMNKPQGRTDFFAMLTKYQGRSAKAHYRPHCMNIRRIEYLKRPAEFSTDELKTLIRVFSTTRLPSYWPGGYGAEDTAKRLTNVLLTKNYDELIFSMAPEYWRIARDTRNTTFHRSMLAFAQKCLRAKKPELAAAFASAGNTIAGAHLSEGLRAGLASLRSRAVANIGGIIPVKRSDPRYPLFAAQADYFSGNVQRAWQQYLAGRSRMTTTFKDLDPSFCTWVVNQNSDAGSFAQAETLARAMIQWMDSDSARFSPDVRVNVLLAYADIPFNKGEYPRASALYGRIAAAKEFEGTRGQIDAELRIAEVHRKSGQPDEAINRLDKLLTRKDRYTIKEANYRLALVRFDMEEYLDAADCLDRVFSLEPTHPGGRILEGKINLKIRRYEQAARIDKVGLSADKQYIVPGKVLRVGMEDRTLAIVGKTTAIEIRAWTDGGDEEIFTLIPFADSKTRFEGSIRTEMAAVVKNDRSLQLLGNDKVYYDLSDKFKVAHAIAETPPHVLTVVSDSELYAASGRILTREQAEELALENMIRQRILLQRRQDLPEQEGVALASKRPEDQVKPGNKINVRVIDFDQGITKGLDNVSVSVAASSGDKIPSFKLTETTPFSGIFEGAIPTESAPAIAYATDSDEGREPNFVISRGKHPAWIALPDNKRPKYFTVDLNGNEKLTDMTITASETGRRIKSFLLQVSPNGKQFKTIGSWPEEHKPWDGVVRGEVIRHYSLKQRSAAETISIFRNALENTSVKERRTIGLMNMTLAAKWREDVFRHADALKIDWNDSKRRWYLIRFSGVFYLKKRETRTFRLVPGNSGPNMAYYLTVDDKVGRIKSLRGRGTDEVPQEFSGVLAKGLHRIDVYVHAIRRSQPSFKVLCDTEQPPYMAQCPREMFDISKSPRALRELGNKIATVAANDDATTFNIKFPSSTRARAIRICMHDFEMDAPAINKITLQGVEDTPTGLKKKIYLPCKVDLMALRNNDTLEIVPGDNISITYEDPKSLSDNTRIREVFLSATYANGTIQPSVVVGYETDRTGMRRAIFVPMRRFEPGDAIQVLIEDPDKDISNERDKAVFTVKLQASNSKEITLRALETGKHTGRFLGKIFPVLGEPKRASEIKVEEGDDLILSYKDSENTDPGIPWVRSAMLEQVWYQEPQMYVYDMTSKVLSEEAIAEAEKNVTIVDEHVPVMYDLIANRHDPRVAKGNATTIIGGTFLSELIWPTIVRSAASSASIYVQTSSGREAAGKQEGEPFDIDVPGTVRIDSYPKSLSSQIEPPPGYRSCVVSGSRYAGDPLDDGRFVFTRPVELGELPDETFAMAPRRKQSFGLMPHRTDEEYEPQSIIVSGDDTLYVGFQYTNDTGETKWITQTVTMRSDAFFDVMERQYQETVSGVYVGDPVYFRIVDKTVDKSSEHDKVELQIKSSSGKTKTVHLTETLAHSGEFKGLLRFVYATDQPAATTDSVWEEGTMPVKYGEILSATYDPGRESAKTIKRDIEIFKGSDGDVLPFTKRFKDPEIAVRTQLTTAEAYFELAKKHRKLKQTKMTKHEIATGKRILQEALRDYPDTDARAQADYLLANLSLEFAEEAENKEAAKRYYMEAISRFSSIVASARDSAYAPKAQFKKALTLEKMGDIDLACAEYVKLSYRWPENELIAETIARLGQYFFSKGKHLNDEAAALTDIVQQEKKKIQARAMFTTAAQVFGRLAPRFPSHGLAEKATILSAQCYMRAESFPKAIGVFMTIVENKDANKDLKAEAMYWCGDCHMKSKDKNSLIEAYRMFKVLTWDYPASKWAKYARGRLADEALARLDDE